MASFILECPACGAINEATTGLFGLKKTIRCQCGREIDIKREAFTSKQCPHCKNTVVVDLRKGDRAICPVCKKPVNTAEDKIRGTDIICPTCSCKHFVDKSAVSFTCPVCTTNIDVQKEIVKSKLVSDNKISVIKYEGDNSTFVWKHPIEDFNAGSQLIVHESQEAVLFRDGIALDSFPSGAYTLEAQKLPIFSSTFKLTSDVSVFHSEVYFINMTTQMGFKWGTPNRIRLKDPISGMNIDIGARGSMNFRVNEPRKLLTKLVGTESTLGRADLESSYVSAFMRDLTFTKVRSCLAQTIKQQNIDLMEIDERLEELAAGIQNAINEELCEYGLIITGFVIANVDLPTDNPEYIKMQKLHDAKILKASEKEVLEAEAQLAYTEASAKANLKVIDSQGDAEAARVTGTAEADVTRAKGMAEADVEKAKGMAEAESIKAKGQYYQMETARMVGTEAMKNGLVGTGGAGGGNSAIGDMASLGVSIGVMSGVIGATKEVIKPVMDAMNPNAAPASAEWTCSCGAKNTGKFCSECGCEHVSASANTWTCSCGTENTGKFCTECGARNPNEPWKCSCGHTNTGKFCSECGAGRGN